MFPSPHPTYAFLLCSALNPVFSLYMKMVIAGAVMSLVGWHNQLRCHACSSRTADRRLSQTIKSAKEVNVDESDDESRHVDGDVESGGFRIIDLHIHSIAVQILLMLLIVVALVVLCMYCRAQCAAACCCIKCCPPTTPPAAPAPVAAAPAPVAAAPAPVAAAPAPAPVAVVAPPAIEMQPLHAAEPLYEQRLQYYAPQQRPLLDQRIVGTLPRASSARAIDDAQSPPDRKFDVMRYYK